MPVFRVEDEEHEECQSDNDDKSGKIDRECSTDKPRLVDEKQNASEETQRSKEHFASVVIDERANDDRCAIHQKSEPHQCHSANMNDVHLIQEKRHAQQHKHQSDDRKTIDRILFHGVLPSGIRCRLPVIRDKKNQRYIENNASSKRCQTEDNIE